MVKFSSSYKETVLLDWELQSLGLWLQIIGKNLIEFKQTESICYQM